VPWPSEAGTTREELFNDKIIILVLLRSSLGGFHESVPMGVRSAANWADDFNGPRRSDATVRRRSAIVGMQQLLERALPPASELLDGPARSSR
jgi:hypothetical protein